MTNEWVNYHKQMKSYGWNGWGIYGLCPVSSFHFESMHILLFHMPSSTGGDAIGIQQWSYCGEKRQMGGLTYRCILPIFSL